MLADKLDVFIVRELDAELGRNRAPERRGVEGLARVGERLSRGEARRNRDVTVRADGGRGALAREELLAVAADAGGVFRVLRDIGEGVPALARVLPVRGGKLVARVALLLRVFGDGVRELRVVAARGLLRRARLSRLRAALRVGRRDVRGARSESPVRERERGEREEDCRRDGLVSHLFTGRLGRPRSKARSRAEARPRASRSHSSLFQEM